MILRNKQYGFSLLEVMMAVVVLTMGMVFIASMFPVGLYNARKTVDATMNAIELNNSIVSAGLKIDAAIAANKNNNPAPLLAGSNCFEFREAPYNLDKLNNNDNNYDSGEEGNPNSIHFLIKPNVLANSFGTNSPVVVVDDIEYVNYKSGNNPENWYAFCSNNGIAYRGASHFLVSIFNNLVLYNGSGTLIAPVVYGGGEVDYEDPVYESGDYALDSTLGELVTSSFVGDISYIACPPVNYMDQDVLDKIVELGGDISATGLLSFSNEAFLNRAVYEVTVDRNYSWAAFYSGNYPYNASGNQDKPEYMYIFILKNHRRNVRYALQNSLSMAYASPVDPIYAGNTTPTSDNDMLSTGVSLPYAASAQYDRHFPVPWLVHLDKPFRNASEIYEFLVAREVADILRPGSIILDADPVGADTRGTFQVFNQRGMLYEVENVRPYDVTDPETRFIVRLKNPFGESIQSNSLFTFWVFPPAINRTTGQFEDEQPVVDVVYRKFEVK